MCGIVGLPNVGKSTLFNTLLKKQTALVANYPFATIEPNVGVVEVPDERLPVLAKIVNTQKIVPAVVEFYDIAGLVKDASKGEGLGNQFLANIREVSAIVHVVRFFEEDNVTHVTNKVDPLSDIQTIEEELMLADLQTLDKQHEPKGNAEEEVATFKLVQQVKEKLNAGTAVYHQALTTKQQQMIKHLNLLTQKAVIFAFNCSLEQLENQQETTLKVQTILQQSNGKDTNFLLFNPLLEETVGELITKAYSTLGLISFLTAGQKEVRAWTIAKGTTAQQAAGLIHTDFATHFIKADVVPYPKFVALGGWNPAREQGAVSSEGKDYLVRDGDVIEFKVNV